MKIIKCLIFKVCIIGFLISIILPINVFAENNFVNDLINKEVEITEESSIFDLTAYVTKQAIDIMDNTKDSNETVKLLDKLLKEYEIQNEVKVEELLNIYLYYDKFFKEDLDKDSKWYMEYNKEQELFREISNDILNFVSDKIAEAVEYEKIEVINEILDKYKLKIDLDDNEIVLHYFSNNYDQNDIYDNISKIFEDYKSKKDIHYRIKTLLNKIQTLESEDEIANQISSFVKHLYIEDGIKIDDILSTYKSLEKEDYSIKEEAIYDIVMKAVKRDRICNIYKEIINDINIAKEESIGEELFNVIQSQGIEGIVSEYHLMTIYDNYKDYGYKNPEEAIFIEGLMVLDVSYPEKTVNDIIDKIIDVMKDKTSINKIIKALDEKSKEEIYEDIDWELCKIFKDYDTIDNFSPQKIVEALSSYKENGYDDYETAAMAEITDMFKNTKLQEGIINIINKFDDTNEVEEIREEISDYIEESDFEKYIDYDAINKINNNTTINQNDRAKAISDVMIDSIVASNEKYILNNIEQIIEADVEEEKANHIRDILIAYNLQDYINIHNVLHVYENYDKKTYDNEKQALFGELFKTFTKSYSQDEKNNIKDEIIKIISEEKSNKINSICDIEENINNTLEDNNLNGYILPKDILNIYYDWKAYGYDSIENGIIKEITNGIVKRIKENIIRVVNSGKEEDFIKKDISRILRNNDLSKKVDADKILKLYHDYKQYGFNSSAEALEKELEKLFDFF